MTNEVNESKFHVKIFKQLLVHFETVIMAVNF